ncbi:MAG TPA: GIY-YIG nuclease family protein [Pirellulales bacterium]|nr:GIY-YIG nuclease family protein [Pirellulales bacterium]
MSQPLEKNHLLECLAQLTIELGRLPSNVEIRLKRRRDPIFPSHGAFARLGDKGQLVSELHKYCDGREGYQGVLLWCESYAPPRRAAAGAERSSGELGRVYLLKSGRFYKIGRTNAVGRREYELAIRLPERATTLHVINTDDPVGIEEYWHKRFQAKRKNGEWFRLDRADVAAFKRRRFM